MNFSNKNISKFQIFIVSLFGLLLCVMCALMFAGGNINAEQFFSIGDIYEVSQAELRESSDTLVYNRTLERYDIKGKVAKKKFVLDGKQKNWKYACVVIGDMSQKAINGKIIGYNRKKERVCEQSVVWTAGANQLRMDDSTEIYAVTLAFLRADGGYIELDEIQFRNGETAFTVERFGKAFLVSGFFYMLLSFLYFKFVKGRRKRNIKHDAIQLPYPYMVFGDFLQKLTYGTVKYKHKALWCCVLYCILFLWMIFGNSIGWNENDVYCRYYILVSSIIILVITILVIAGEKYRHKWNRTFLCLWLGMWILSAISSYFLISRIHLTGIVMLTIGGMFLYALSCMNNPFEMYRYMAKGLEWSFIIAVVFCVFFRPWREGIEYHGIFDSADGFAMYCVLANGIFLLELIRVFAKSQTAMEAVLYSIGFGLSLFFVLITESVNGAAALLLAWSSCILANGKFLVIRIKSDIQKYIRKIILTFVVTGICVVLAGVSVQTVPVLLHTEIEFESEKWYTNLSWKELAENQEKGEMQNVSSKDARELDVVWKNYVWNINLLGHAEELQVFRERAVPYNSYLTMVYRYGLFILLPYIGFQIMLLGKTIEVVRYEKLKSKGCSAKILAAMVTVIFLCFCIGGNPEQEMAHPLWFLFYGGNAILFLEGGESLNAEK